MQVLLALMNAGMRETSVRFTKECEGRGQLGRLLGTTTGVVLVSGLFAALLSLGLLPVFRLILHEEEVGRLVLLGCMATLFQALSLHMMTFYRACNKPIPFMMAGLAGAGLLFATSFSVLCIMHRGIEAVLWSYLVSYAVVFAAVSIDIVRKTGIRVSPAMLPACLRFGGPLVHRLVCGNSETILSHISRRVTFFCLDAVPIGREP